MTKKSVHHPSLEELMNVGGSLEGMIDAERERWLARTRPTKEGLERRALDIWNRAILSRPHIKRPSKPPGTSSNRKFVDLIPARVVTKTRSTLA